METEESERFHAIEDNNLDHITNGEVKLLDDIIQKNGFETRPPLARYTLTTLKNQVISCRNNLKNILIAFLLWLLFKIYYNKNSSPDKVIIESAPSRSLASVPTTIFPAILLTTSPPPSISSETNFNQNISATIFSKTLSTRSPNSSEIKFNQKYLMPSTTNPISIETHLIANISTTMKMYVNKDFNKPQDVHRKSQAESKRYQPSAASGINMHHMDKWLEHMTCYPQKYHLHIDEDCWCNENWAYNRIYKSGSSAVDRHCSCLHNQRGVRDIHKLSETMKSSRSIFTFVRDPLDHFVSGFIECSYRVFNHWDGGPYDPVKIKTPPVKTPFISKYLDDLHIPGKKFSGPYSRCSVHSNPQVWFITNHVDAIMDLGDMEAYFAEEKLPWKNDLPQLRAYEGKHKLENDAKSLIHRNKDLMKRICKVIAIDYCLLDFEPPDLCANIVKDFCNGHCRKKN